MVTWTTFLPLLTRNGQLCTFIFWQQHGIHVWIFAKPFSNQSIYTICSPSRKGKNINNNHLKIIVDDGLNLVEFQFPPTHTNWC